MKLIGTEYSIRRKLRVSFIIIIVLLIIPSFTGIIFMSHFSGKYSLLINNLTLANSTMTEARGSTYNEMWEIVSGRKTFSESRDSEIIEGLLTDIQQLKLRSSSRESYKLMEVEERTVTTLVSYIDRLREQVEQQTPVDEHMKILEEIRGVSELMYDLLQEYSTLEISATASVAASMNHLMRFIILIEILLMVMVSFLTIRFVRIVINDISLPILKLEEMSVRIADGDLKVQVQEPRLEELVGLTKSLNRMTVKLDYLMEEGIRKEQELLKTELKALQAQIAPHFLYNTLDTIISLAEAGRSEDVVDITSSFARFFRVSLSKGNDFISVERELTHVNSYLEIQKVRYRDILDFEVHVDEEMMNMRMLKLLLQPLVENSLYHGIKTLRGRGKISVKGFIEDNQMVFSVIDTGIGMDEQTLQDLRAGLVDSSGQAERGYGLYNVDRRIKLYYHSNSGLVIDSVKNEGTTVTFCLPAKSVYEN